MPRGGHNIKPPEDRVNRVTGIKDRRAGKGKVVSMHKHPAPSLKAVDTEGWPEQTFKWWDMWTRSPLTADFAEEDWSELLDTAHLHALFWTPELRGTPAWFKASAQLRQRTANYGATPLDRQRLRIQVVFADEAEEKQAERKGNAPQPPSSARARRGPLKAV